MLLEVIKKLQANLFFSKLQLLKLHTMNIINKMFKYNKELMSNKPTKLCIVKINTFW